MIILIAAITKGKYNNNYVRNRKNRKIICNPKEGTRQFNWKRLLSDKIVSGRIQSIYQSVDSSTCSNRYVSVNYHE